MDGKKLIYADDFISSLRDDPLINGANFKRVVQHINDAPAVDAVEVVHGSWIEEREIPSYRNKNIPVVECSKCRCFFCDIINVHSFMYHYCPNCGAKMDGGNEDG